MGGDCWHADKQAARQHANKKGTAERRAFLETPDVPAADRSGRAQIDRFGALAHAVGLDVEGDLLAIDEGAQAGSLDRRDVDEHILGAAVRRDETEAFGRVEEFYGAGLGHAGGTPSPVAVCLVRATAPRTSWFIG